MTETALSKRRSGAGEEHSISLQQRTSSEEKEPSTPSPLPNTGGASASGVKLSLVQRLSTHSYGQAREMIAKEMRENKEAIARLEARIETLVNILHQAGVELPPYPKPKE